jgi:hypothetical protein
VATVILQLPGPVYEGGGFLTLARVMMDSGSAGVNSDVVTSGSKPLDFGWDLRVFDMSDAAGAGKLIYESLNNAAVDSGTQKILAASLQTDAAWTLDNTGYNFRHRLTAGTLPIIGGRRYRVEYRVKLSPDGPTMIVTTNSVVSTLGVA